MATTPSWTDRLSAGAVLMPLLAILAWAPVPYASNRPWSWSLLAALVALALIVQAVAVLVRRERPPVPAIVWLAGIGLAAVAGWGWLQTVPIALLPAWAGDLAHPIWAEMRPLLPDVQPIIGLDAAAGRDAVMRLVAYGGVFWLAFQAGSDPERARQLTLVVVVVIAADAAYGLVNQFAGWNTVLWEADRKAYTGYVTGTFVNRNSFATYCNIGVLLALALLLEPFLRAQAGSDLRRIAADVMEKLLGRRSPLLLALIVMVSASLLTVSRGGFLSAVVAAGAFGVMLLGVAKVRWRVLAPILAVMLLAAWAIVAFSGQATLKRLDQTEETLAGRTEIWALSRQMIDERPLLGHGYGNYFQTWFLHRDESFGPLLVDKAHNTFLEHAVELGVPMTAVLYLGPLGLLAYCVRGVLVRRRDQIFALSAVSTTVLVAVHALVDFSLQIPAVAVTYAAILGIGVAQSMPSRRQVDPATSQRRERRRSREAVGELVHEPA